MNKCALVTGGAGFIGSHVVEHLLESGWKVRVLDDLSTGNQANLAAVGGKIEFIPGSVTDATAVARAVTGVEAVFHLAAKVFVPESFQIPAEYERVNVAGTALVLEAARRAGVRRVVFSSTCAVYGNPPELPISEATPPRPPRRPSSSSRSS
jgi:UDP-glucose 4-epimerase